MLYQLRAAIPYLLDAPMFALMVPLCRPADGLIFAGLRLRQALARQAAAQSVQ